MLLLATPTSPSRLLLLRLTILHAANPGETSAHSRLQSRILSTYGHQSTLYTSRNLLNQRFRSRKRRTRPTQDTEEPKRPEITRFLATDVFQQFGMPEEIEFPGATEGVRDARGLMPRRDSAFPMRDRDGDLCLR